MKVDDTRIVYACIYPDSNKILEPKMHGNDLLIPWFDPHGEGVYLRISGKLIKQIVDANTPHTNKIKQ